jgi:hypothetical protein
MAINQGARKLGRKRDPFDINQCALYKIGSKQRLASVLLVSLDDLIRISESTANYRTFKLEEEICPFTGKVRRERWVQDPKPQMRRIHERILKLLRGISPPHYTHAAVKRRSYRSNAIEHLNGERIATFDIKSFYSSTSASRTFSFFHDDLKCAPDVARLLTKITTFEGGLPTGSPLSPLLSLYSNKPLFDQLDELAKQHELLFTCYMDDITFSGNFIPTGFKRVVSSIVYVNGHRLSLSKTRVYRRNHSMHVTGVVIYRGRIQVPHSRFRKARAIVAAIDSEIRLAEKAALSRKLAGLLGEAAYLDTRYSAWAKRSYEDLKLVENLLKSEENSTTSSMTEN